MCSILDTRCYSYECKIFLLFGHSNTSFLTLLRPNDLLLFHVSKRSLVRRFHIKAQLAHTRLICPCRSLCNMVDSMCYNHADVCEKFTLIPKNLCPKQAKNFTGIRSKEKCLRYTTNRLWQVPYVFVAVIISSWNYLSYLPLSFFND